MSKQPVILIAVTRDDLPTCANEIYRALYQLGKRGKHPWKILPPLHRPTLEEIDHALEDWQPDFLVIDFANWEDPEGPARVEAVSAAIVSQVNHWQALNQAFGEFSHARILLLIDNESEETAAEELCLHGSKYPVQYSAQIGIDTILRIEDALVDLYEPERKAEFRN